MEGCVRIFVYCVSWRQNGVRHRTAGPAIVWADEINWWFLRGVHLTEEEFNERRK